jgi:hypothetical protein
MAPTMLNVSIHTMRLCPPIPTSASTTPTIVSGTGLYAGDSDGTFHYLLSKFPNINIVRFTRWQNGAPPGQKTIVSRLIQNPYWTRQCAEWFPTENGYTYGLNAGATYNTANEYTGGWDGFADSTRVIFVSGTNDPWRTSQVVSPLRPGGPLPSTPARPVLEVPGGFHTSDLVTENGVVNPGCAAVQSQVVSQVKEWVSEYPSKK